MHHRFHISPLMLLVNHPRYRQKVYVQPSVSPSKSNSPFVNNAVATCSSITEEKQYCAGLHEELLDHMELRRCCSDTTLDADVNPAAPYFVNDKCPAVYAASKMVALQDGTRCGFSEPWSGANSICKSVGARLCTNQSILSIIYSSFCDENIQNAFPGLSSPRVLDLVRSSSMLWNQEEVSGPHVRHHCW